MIITCDQCKKKFQISSELIPQSGRLLQCSFCSNTWFYKKDKNEILENKTTGKEKVNIEKNDQIIEKKTSMVTKAKIIDQLSKPSIDISPHDETSIIPDSLNVEDESKNLEKLKKNNTITKNKFFNYLLVFIISSIALILILDTFKSSINTFIPNFDFFLESLYEALTDIYLFIKDLF